MEKIGTEHKKTICIYKIINTVTGKVYIGSTINLYGRITNHLKALSNGAHHNMGLQNDWNVYKSENFIHEIIEIVENKDSLPELEKKYINLYQEKNGVYNVSDPTTEIIHWRQDNARRYKGSNIESGEYLLSKSFILEWLEENFNQLIKQMKIKIDEKQYFEASKIDEWIINRIDDIEIKNDHRLIELIHKWYNKHKFCVIPSNMYKKELKEVLGINFYPNKNLIMTNELNKKLYAKKNKK